MRGRTALRLVLVVGVLGLSVGLVPAQAKEISGTTGGLTGYHGSATFTMR